MTDKEMYKVAKIIAIAKMNSPTCKKCRTYTWCPFAYDCLTNEYKWFKERAAANFFKKLFKNS